MGAPGKRSGKLASISAEEKFYLFFLCLVAVVILSAVLYIRVDTSPGPNTPVATMTWSTDDGGNYTLTVSEIEPQPSLENVQYQLLDANWVLVDQGRIHKLIAGEKNSSPVMYNDTDSDESMSAGDTIILLSSDGGGIAREGYIFRLVYLPSSKSIAFVELT